MATETRGGRLRLPAILGYAAGSLGVGVYSTVPGILLLYYMTQVLALPVALASLAVLLPKLAIIVVEPMVGAWSDRVRARSGSRRPFLLVGAFASAAIFVVLFNTPRLAEPVRTFGLVSAAYLAASLAFSLFAVPYVAMPAEMSADPVERARIVGWRMAFVFGGVLLGAAAPPILVDRFGGGALGYSRMAVVIAGLSWASMLVSFAAAARRRPQDGALSAAKGGSALGVLRYAPYATALAIYVLIMSGTAAFTAAAPYFITYVLAAPQTELAPMFVTQILAALSSMAVWAWLTPRLRFSRTLILALVCAFSGVLMLVRAHAGQSVVDHLASFALMGVGGAGVQVAAFALLADVTDRYGRRAGERRDGLMTGLWTAAEKVALALGPAAITGAVLAQGGFVSAAPRSAEPASALDAARLAASAAPALVFVLAAIALVLARKTLDPEADKTVKSPLRTTDPEQAVG